MPEHRLVELRAYLEKIRPIDKQLSYQIDKLLKAAAVANTAEAAAAAGARGRGGDEEGAAGPGPGSANLDADALNYGPRPDALVPKLHKGVAAAAGAGGDAGGLAGLGGVL